MQTVFLDNRDKLIRFLASHGAEDAAEDLLHELWFRLSSADTGPIGQPLAYLYRAVNNLRHALSDLNFYIHHRCETRARRRIAERLLPKIDAHSAISPRELLIALGERHCFDALCAAYRVAKA